MNTRTKHDGKDERMLINAITTEIHQKILQKLGFMFGNYFLWVLAFVGFP